MIRLQKDPARDFIVLNLTDPQLSDGEWEAGHPNRTILTQTVRELVERVHPDLITISGDLAWAGHRIAYKALADFLDGFGIPWAPVWGNHDNQDGPAFVNEIADLYLTYPHCAYEKGDPAMGNGNYVILVEEDGRPVTGIFLMDTHDRMPYTNADGTEGNGWAKLLPCQIDWYRREAEALKAMGCHDTALISHIPIYAYTQATAAAYREGVDLGKMTLAESMTPEVWNPGYEAATGVQYEGIGCYPQDEGMMDVLCEVGTTQHVLAGHDHVNNWIIPYRGVRLVYTLKTGAGCYWNPTLNGGTILRISQRGIREVRHEYVDPQLPSQE